MAEREGAVRRAYAEIGDRLIGRTLRSKFRRVCWVGPAPELPDDRPLVIYANHHHFYDGHLLWYWIRHHLGRVPLTWMEDLDAFPFFGPLGALPFPADAPRRRAATVRYTAARMQADPRTTLFYFPERRLHPPEEGVLPFGSESFERFDRILPPKFWWPVAVHVTWRGESLPTVLLSGGPLRASSDGREHEHLDAVWSRLRHAVPTDTHTLIEGRRSPHENWNFRFLGRLFSRRT